MRNECRYLPPVTIFFKCECKVTNNLGIKKTFRNIFANRCLVGWSTNGKSRWHSGGLRNGDKRGATLKPLGNFPTLLGKNLLRERE